LIYLVRFDEVSFDEKSQTISVGGGCLWEQVYREAWKFERGVIGGSTSEGVGELARGIYLVILMLNVAQESEGG
jgi:hypothetical protein